ncbi:nitroreductase family protein [Kitasatospora sp. MAP5-34]|uniref:Acg family FMN-binding oxidoreductase n=1 Tax=Kitasatospora sp. MAP5-34 TaxID=3035102 RepID=UPI00247501ED|nr:nitroreductase family protein [Kitasatospora sp. MAP5-34]MDH6574715.1 nitroreductase [Kitasatospora sp. MAP5-34]
MLTSTLDAATLEKLVSAAVAAPSMHNTQPWRFRFRPETTTLEVRAVPQATLQVSDPADRAVYVSVGAAVFNLRVAVRHLGREPVVRLLPHPAEPDLLAAVRLAGPTRTAAAGQPDLHEAIWRRHSSRLPFSDQPVDPAVLAELAEAALAEGAELDLPSEAEVHRLLAVTAEAERRNTTEPRRSAESRHAIHGADDGPYGIPAAALGPQDVHGRLPVRDFSAIRPAEHLPPALFERHPCIGLLSTAHDEPADWLRAGQALEHVLLLATAHGLQASLLHQAMEWPDLRWSLRDPRHGPGHPQMLIRLGYGPDGAATPRSAAADVLDGGPDAPA